MALTRRHFLKSSGIALAGAAAPSFLIRPAFAQKDHPIIIALFQRGAADGLSMVVPFGDKNYYAARPQIAIPEPVRGAEERGIDLDGFFALHPSLQSLKAIYDEGHLGIVHAVGSPASTRSHFDAQDYMESGIPGRKGVPDGWLNRYMQASVKNNATPFRSVAMSATLPRSMMGSAPAVALQRVQDFGIRGGRATADVEALFAELYKDTFDAVEMLRRARPEQYTPAAGVEYPNSSYGRALLQIAQLIKSNIGLEVAFADIGGWDTHAAQGSARGQLSNRLREFGDSIAALYRDLGDRMRNVVILSMTEFGRSVRQNGSGGTDHGRGSCLFVAGGAVKGGKVYGTWPGLTREQLFEDRDVAVTTDFRDVFAEILVKHMGARDVSKVFPNFTPNPNLKIL
jgi:uncharacterized protein (DUF1501 family)